MLKSLSNLKKILSVGIKEASHGLKVMNTTLEEFNLHQEKVKPIREIKHILTIAKIHFDFFVKISHSKKFFHYMEGGLVVDIITALFALTQKLLNKGIAGDDKIVNFLINAIDEVKSNKSFIADLNNVNASLTELKKELIENGFKNSGSHISFISDSVEHLENEWLRISDSDKKALINEIFSSSTDALKRTSKCLDSIAAFVDTSLKAEVNSIKKLISDLLAAQQKQSLKDPPF